MKARNAYSRLPASSDDFKLEIISLQTGKEIHADYKQVLNTTQNISLTSSIHTRSLNGFPHLIALIRVFIKNFIHAVHTSPQTRRPTVPICIENFLSLYFVTMLTVF